MNTIRLAAVQTKTDLHNRAENVVHAVDYIAQAAAQGAQLVCLPETYPGPWTTPVDYDAQPALAEAAREHNIFVAAGLIEPVSAKAGWYYTSHTLIDNMGQTVGTYRRTTPTGPWLYRGSFFWDFDWQEANDFPVFETDLGKIALVICSEVYMPEVSRAMALQGAEIILLPAGVPKGPMWETWRTLIFARAIENVCFTVTCQNLFKPEDQGLAMICSPEHILAESTEAGVLVADCDVARLRLLRNTDDSWDFPGVKHCKPGIFKQWYRAELHGQTLAQSGQPTAPPNPATNSAEAGLEPLKVESLKIESTP